MNTHTFLGEKKKIFIGYPAFWSYSDSVYHEQMPKNAISDQGLQFTLFIQHAVCFLQIKSEMDLFKI